MPCVSDEPGTNRTEKAEKGSLLQLGELKANSG